MPVHDWSRVGAGTFHHFHNLWMVAISNALNDGRLPAAYYAMVEQIAGDREPDVLTLQESGAGESGDTDWSSTGVLAVATVPPAVRFTAETEMERYTAKQKHVVIRHTSGDRVVAFVEVVSRGNKRSREALRRFVEKIADVLSQGYHILVVDLHPPTSRDPQGVHGAIWSEICDDSYVAPSDKPLTVVAYSAGPVKKAFIEPIAVGDSLPDMPLFLDPGHYVLVPLEGSYQAAWHGVPRRWQKVLETPA